jgi:hypothetical protein
VKSYEARRRLLIGTSWREPGEPVPEAHDWRLVESLVRAGEMVEVDVTVRDLSASIQKYCPDEADAIYARLGITAYEPEPEPEPESAAPRPRRPRKPPVLVELPEPLEG